MISVKDALDSTGSVWINDEEYKGICNFNEKGLLHYKGFTSPEYIADKETRVALNCQKLSHLNPNCSISTDYLNKIIDEFEQNENEGRKLHYKQREGIMMVCNNYLSVLTGGPGTGKTTVLSGIAYALRKINPETQIVYTAPTGKAANRIKESTGENATTLHKKLGVGRGILQEPFKEDVLFIDEASMLDLDLADILFKQIPLGKRLVLVGDTNQLPSVGIGRILGDLIESKAIPCTQLTKTFRQDDSSTLFKNIENVKKGKAELIEGNDFHSIKLDDDADLNDIAKMMRQVYVENVEEYGIDGVCLLLPYRRHTGKTISSDLMAPFLQSAVLKTSPNQSVCMHRKDGVVRKFYAESRIMQLENRNECANGDVGIVTAVSERSVTAVFNGIEVSYQDNEINQIALANAMTVHKSQGSEYPVALVGILNNHDAMLNRNILYTAITRAKKKCILFYQEEALNKALATIADENRHSFLAEKIHELDIQYRVGRHF